MPQMVFNKCRNEVVTMVITGVISGLDRQTTFCTRLLKQLGAQLFLEVRVVKSLVDEYAVMSRRILEISRNFTGIVIVPA